MSSLSNQVTDIKVEQNRLETRTLKGCKGLLSRLIFMKQTVFYSAVSLSSGLYHPNYSVWSGLCKVAHSPSYPAKFAFPQAHPTVPCLHVFILHPLPRVPFSCLFIWWASINFSSLSSSSHAAILCFGSRSRYSQSILCNPLLPCPTFWVATAYLSPRRLGTANGWYICHDPLSYCHKNCANQSLSPDEASEFFPTQPSRQPLPINWLEPTLKLKSCTIF